MIYNLLTHPTFWLGFFVLMAWRSWQKKRRQRAVHWGGLSALVFGLYWCSPFTHWLIGGLEKNYEVFDSNKWETASDTVFVMALGAGHCCDPHLPPNQQLDPPELQRTIEAVRIYQSLAPQYAKVYFVGSGRQSPNASCPQALSVTRTAILLGVNPSDTALLLHTTDTETEAAAFARRFGTQHPVILVSHAHHLPRAMAWFNAHGIPGIPAPAHFYSRQDPADKRWWRKWFYDSNNIELWKYWVHEKLGMGELYLETRNERRETIPR